MPKYPHMVPGLEVELWETFMRLFGKEYDRFDYDVRLGQGAKPHRELPENIARDLKMLTQKRVDAVGWKGEQPYIFEVKPFAGLSAVGALVGYKHLWVEEGRSRREPILCLVTNQINRDTQRVCEREGIKVFVF